jgi:hypothetical protein
MKNQFFRSGVQSTLRMPESEIEYRNALIDAANLGAYKALEMAGAIKPHLKLREAFRLYGEAVVKRWIKEDLIHTIKDGSRNASVRISRVELEATARTCNRATYLTTDER